MREITTHKVSSVESPRIFAVDKPDPNAGGMHHVYAVVWGTNDGDDMGEVGDLDQGYQLTDLGVKGELYLGNDSGGFSVKGAIIRYQHGPVKEAGPNGLQGECLRAIEIDRLDCANKGPFPCRENSLAKTKLEESLMWGQERTRRRRDAGAEGRNVRVQGDHDATKRLTDNNVDGGAMGDTLRRLGIGSDGHVTVFQFTTGYKVLRFTPEMDQQFRDVLATLPSFMTLDEALKEAKSRDSK
jgi:hypothetical protein